MADLSFDVVAVDQSGELRDTLAEGLVLHEAIAFVTGWSEPIDPPIFEPDPDGEKLTAVILPAGHTRLVLVSGPESLDSQPSTISLPVAPTCCDIPRAAIHTMFTRYLSEVESSILGQGRLVNSNELYAVERAVGLIARAAEDAEEFAHKFEEQLQEAV